MKSLKRIIVKHNSEYLLLPIEDIVLITKMQDHVILYDKYSKEYRHKCSISGLMEVLDKSDFFQANRQQILNIHFIRGFKIFEKVKLMVLFTFIHKQIEVIVSQETAPHFKKWLCGYQDPHS